MSARLWTHGWDFFAPGHHIVYHLWSRDYRPTFRELDDVHQLEKRSLRRISFILGMNEDGGSSMREDDHDQDYLLEIDEYGLGSADGRDLEAFERHTGVCFRNRTISSMAKRGGLPESFFMDSIVALIASHLQRPT